MPERILFPSFRDDYQNTRYPFMDTATLLSASGQSLDRDVFLDASIYPVGADGYVHISTIDVLPQSIRIAISDKSRKELAAVTFNPLDATPNLSLFDQYQRPAGVLVSDVDRLSRFTSWALGQHTFTAAAATFVPSCVIPVPATGVRGLSLDDGTIAVGDVLLVGRNGVVLREVTAGEIRIDIVGDPLYRRRLCSPIDLFQNVQFIRTINGCPPDAHGNFNLTIGSHESDTTIVRLRKTDTGITIEAVGTTLQSGVQ